MAQVVNIAGREPIDDPEYRYKMPRLMGKVEGRGNGIKTALVNMRDVANALHRPPDEVTKFFGCELGAQTNWVDATDKSIVNGAHTDVVLMQLLHKYIDLFVLCPNCRLPESHYKIKNGIIYHNCLACGARETADMSHKLSTFILNSHKKAKREKAKEKGSKEKDGSRRTSKDATNGGTEEDGGKEKKSKKDKKEKKEKKSKKDKNNKKDKASEDGTNSEEGDERSRNSGEPGAGADGDDSDDLSDAPATLDNLEVDDAGAFDNCVASIRRHLDDGKTPEAMLEELRTAQTFSAFPLQYRIHLYVAAAFAEAAVVTEEAVAACTPVLKLLTHGADDQRHVIGAFELLCAQRNTALKPFFPVALKFLYDADLVEEESVLAWAAQGHNADFTPPSVSEEMVEDLQERARPFITWLQEAEEDGSDDDEEEEEEEE